MPFDKGKNVVAHEFRVIVIAADSEMVVLVQCLGAVAVHSWFTNASTRRIPRMGRPFKVGPILDVFEHLFCVALRQRRCGVIGASQ